MASSGSGSASTASSSKEMAFVAIISNHWAHLRPLVFPCIFTRSNTKLYMRSLTLYLNI